MTGYDLKTRCFDDTASHFWTADQAQIYRTLERLEAKGLATSDVEVQYGRPDRKVYRPTEEGVEALKDWLARPRPLPAVRDPLLAQLFFCGELPDEDIVGLLDSARRDHQRRLDGLRSKRADLGMELHASPQRKRHAMVHEMTIDASVSRERATIDWLDDCIESVKTGLPGPPTRPRPLLGR
jgi:DNA-binding PadR family transcriptional regulator